MVKLTFLGDLMLGRGIDQVMPHPCPPHLYEQCVKDARVYVELAEQALGGARIPRPVGYEYVWGDALYVLEKREHVGECQQQVWQQERRVHDVLLGQDAQQSCNVQQKEHTQHMQKEHTQQRHEAVALTPPQSPGHRETATPLALRIGNLETAVTRSERAWIGKGINYRASPENAIGCLRAARIDCCTLANNHVLDWGYAGLDDTIRTLRHAGIATCGAGANLREASRPAVLTASMCGVVRRVLVFGYAHGSSGVPEEWAATEHRAGVNMLREVSTESAMRVLADIERWRSEEGATSNVSMAAASAEELLEGGTGASVTGSSGTGTSIPNVLASEAAASTDVIVVSVHWGGNWGFAVPQAHRDFARTLAEHGVDIVHGHSSHHVMGAEIYRRRTRRHVASPKVMGSPPDTSSDMTPTSLILYGCGDFINDYEGIHNLSEEGYRADLACAFVVDVGERRDMPLEVDAVAFKRRAFRLERATPEDQLCVDEMLSFG